MDHAPECAQWRPFASSQWRVCRSAGRENRSLRAARRSHRCAAAGWVRQVRAAGQSIPPFLAPRDAHRGRSPSKETPRRSALSGDPSSRRSPQRWRCPRKEPELSPGCARLWFSLRHWRPTIRKFPLAGSGSLRGRQRRLPRASYRGTSSPGLALQSCGLISRLCGQRERALLGARQNIVAEPRRELQVAGLEVESKDCEFSLYGSWGIAWRQNFRVSRETCCYTVCKHGEEPVVLASEFLAWEHAIVVGPVPRSWWNSSTVVRDRKSRGRA